jgi:hypothetical protein
MRTASRAKKKATILGQIVHEKKLTILGQSLSLTGYP